MLYCLVIITLLKGTDGIAEDLAEAFSQWEPSHLKYSSHDNRICISGAFLISRSDKQGASFYCLNSPGSRPVCVFSFRALEVTEHL